MERLVSFVGSIGEASPEILQRRVVESEELATLARVPAKPTASSPSRRLPHWRQPTEKDAAKSAGDSLGLCEL